MVKGRSWADLDVHARSVVAVTLDALLSMLADRKNQADDQEEAFAMELEFDWDLHPVFPRAGKVSKALPHVENEGVPCCPHGLMHRDRHDDFPTATWRKTNDIPRGERAREDDTRIRWNCPDEVPGAPTRRRGRATTRACTPSTPAPETASRDQEDRTSNPERSIESVFSSLKGRGVGGKGHHRLKLIGDSPADWIISLAALHLTAARVAHETGAYADTYTAAEHLGYLTDTTDDEPFPHPTISEARRIAAANPTPRGVAPRSLRRPT